MATKWIYMVVLDLFMLTNCKPEPYRDPYKPDYGKPPWGHGDWGSHGWDHPWGYHGWDGHPWGYHNWDHGYTTHRTTTKGIPKATTVAQKSTDTRSPSTFPQPTIRDIDLRIGEMSSVAVPTRSTLTVGLEEPLIQATSLDEHSGPKNIILTTGQPYSTPKFYTLVLKDDKKDKLDTSDSASDTTKLDTEDSEDDSDNLDLTPGIRHESIKVESQPNKLDTSVSASDTTKLDTEDSEDDSDNLDLTPGIRHESIKVESQPNKLDTSVSASDTTKMETEDSEDDPDNLDLTPGIRHESIKVESQPNKLDTSVSASDTTKLDTEDSEDDPDNLDLTPGIRHESIKVESQPNKLNTSVSASDTTKLDTEDSEDDPDNLDLTPGIRHESFKVESQPNTGLENAIINVQQENKWHVGIYERELSKNEDFKVFRKYKCGGSLIKADMVISAGHCFWSPVFKQLPAAKFEAAAGKMYREWEDTRDKNAQYVHVRIITITPIHEPCRQPDLAFVRVDPDFVFNSFVKPVCINFEEVLEYQQLSKGRFATISSSAIIDGAGACQPSEQIHWRSLPYVDVRPCTNDQVMVNRLSSRICAGKANSKDNTQCESDSGNGLVFFEDKIPYLRGVATFTPTDSLCMKYNTTSFTNLGAMKVQADEKFQIFHDILMLKQCGDFYKDKTETVILSSLTVTQGKVTQYDADNGGFGTSTQSIGSLPVPGLNGTSAPAFQWHVGVYSKKWLPFMQICGGSLVKTDFVISAAHCFWDSQTGLQSPTQFAVAGGKLYRPWDDQHDTYAQQSDVADIIIPVRFRGSATSFQDDIAILRLESPFTYALGVQPVCLDFSMELDKEHLQPGTEGTVAGWGLTAENGVPSQRLNYLKMPYVDLDECFAQSDPAFYKYITSDKICAGAQNTGQALCRGDSGSGLVISDSAPYLRGIASTAANNDNLCNAYTLAAFTHVYAHRSFLRDHIPGVENECDRTNQGVQALCRGDSGSGLVVSDSAPYLRGIASTAVNNDNLCNAYTLAAFTHVHAHLSFLRDNILDVQNECRTNTNQGIKKPNKPIRNQPAR